MSKESFVKYRVNDKKYFEIMNYLRGIKEIEEAGEDNLKPYFICKEGAVYFIKFPNSEKGIIVRSKGIKISDNAELNEELIKGLEARLKN
jgi:hypothetical protein